MTTPELGKLEYVPVRDIWPDEARGLYAMVGREPGTS